MTLEPFHKFCEVVSSRPARIAVVLGSGMSLVAKQVTSLASGQFGDIPGLCGTTVAGHRGRLTLGVWAGQRVLLFEGRLHYYEGYSWDAVVAPVRIASELGAKVLLLTNAAGGIHDALVPGSFMAITDHIEWTRPNCWRHSDRGSTAQPRLSPYSPRLIRALASAADGLRIPLHTGVYAAVTGPSYETPAEIQALKRWGADAVGMSTAREAQFGFERGMECAATSCITNRAAGLNAAPLNHEEVLHTAASQSKQLGELLESVLPLFH